MPLRLHWTAGLHHDGSAHYVSNPLPKLGETVTISLRAPRNAPIRHIFLRTAPDGENHMEKMDIAQTTTTAVFWTAKLPVTMPLNTYRFKIMSDEGAFVLNAAGVSRAESLDMFDFKLLADFATPSWLEDAVFYQIFPDRFYNGDPSLNHKPGEWTFSPFKVQLREWGALPLPYAETGNLDFYGGDLPGIIQKLDYLQDLGINAIYLTPIFASSSNHRYNIDDFFNVDKHLGGNEGLVQLRRAMDERNMRLILDVTPNHTSSTHPWFLEAQKNPNAPSAEYYTFHKRPDDYVAWFGVKSLPKLNYASQKLHDLMYRNPDSVLRFWLKAPYRIDGWRLDVYNMTARQGSLQLNEEVGRGIRQAVKDDNPEAYIFGEHFYDGTPYLQGDQLDAIMNYQGFNLPMWRWLAGYDLGREWRPESSDTALLPSDALVEQLTHHRAAVPWVIARQQFNQLCSHDTVRILNIVNGDKSLMKLGVVMLMTYPGVPCVYYGDEIGLPGGKDPDNRRCMPWDETEWDAALRDFYKQIIRLRRSAPALKHGGFQQLYAEGGLWVFQRQSREQQLVVIGYRGPDNLNTVTIPIWHAGIGDGMLLVDQLGGETVTVNNGTIILPRLKMGDALLLEVQK